MDDKKDRFKITKRFMAQTDRDRKFYGTIRRGSDEDGHPVVGGKIDVYYGFVVVMSACQDNLG